MRIKKDSKLNRIRMRLNIGRSKQSSVRGTNSDNISMEANICYDSSFIEPQNADHDEEFHVYDDVVNCRLPEPGEGNPLYENTNQMQIPSAQHVEVPREYEIPVQRNSSYQLRDTPNEYEN